MLGGTVRSVAPSASSRISERAAYGHAPRRNGAGPGWSATRRSRLTGSADLTDPSAVQAAARQGEDEAVLVCLVPPLVTANQLPAARNRSTTLCGMRPRGETSILFAWAHARTAWAL